MNPEIWQKGKISLNYAHPWSEGYLLSLFVYGSQRHCALPLHLGLGFFVWIFNVHRQQLGYLADGSQGRRLTILRAATQRQSRETMTSVSTGNIILTPSEPVRRGGSNP